MKDRTAWEYKWSIDGLRRRYHAARMAKRMESDIQQGCGTTEEADSVKRRTKLQKQFLRWKRAYYKSWDR